MLYDSGITSCPLYTEFPLTIQDLVWKRLPNQQEVPVLCLLPAQPFTLCPGFMEDMQKENQHKQSL
jgi:hypothetical protein